MGPKAEKAAAAPKQTKAKAKAAAKEEAKMEKIAKKAAKGKCGWRSAAKRLKPVCEIQSPVLFNLSIDPERRAVKSSITDFC